VGRRGVEIRFLNLFISVTLLQTGKRHRSALQTTEKQCRQRISCILKCSLAQHCSIMFTNIWCRDAHVMIGEVELLGNHPF